MKIQKKNSVYEFCSEHVILSNEHFYVRGLVHGDGKIEQGGPKDTYA